MAVPGDLFSGKNVAHEGPVDQVIGAITSDCLKRTLRPGNRRVFAILPGLGITHSIPIVVPFTGLGIGITEYPAALAVYGPAVDGIPKDVIHDFLFFSERIGNLLTRRHRSCG